ncbi:hypothetical protein ABPG75_010287 [Micractinium tetrahymenae]
MRNRLVALLVVAICGLAAARQLSDGDREHGRRLAQAPATALWPWKWWRRPLIRTSCIAIGAVLVVKTDIKGGMPPGGSDCDGDGDLQVPMNNTYTVYACKDLMPVPHAPKCDDPGSASTEWEQAANATCTGSTLKVTAGGGTYWADASDLSAYVFPLTHIVGEPMCAYIQKSGGSGTSCGGSATYACLKCP